MAALLNQKPKASASTGVFAREAAMTSARGQRAPATPRSHIATRHAPGAVAEPFQKLYCTDYRPR